MLLIRCPGAAPATRPSSATAGRRTSPIRPTPRRSATPSGPSSSSCGTTRKGVGRALVPRRRMPSMVQRGPRHRDPSLRRHVPPRRGAAAVTGRRLGRRHVDRPVPPDQVHVRRSRGRGLRGRHARERAARLGRTRRVRLAAPRAAARDRDGRGGGTERLRRDLGAVVRADRPGTMVNLVDGLRVAGRAGVGCCPRRRSNLGPPAMCTATSRCWSSGRARRSGRRGWRPRAAAAGCCWSTSITRPEPPAGVTILANTTASGHLRRRLRPVLRARSERTMCPARTRRSRDPRRRRARAALRVRRQRPAGRDARLGRPDLPGAFRCPGRSALVVFSTNHAGHETAEALDAAGAQVIVIDPSPEVGKASERLRGAGIEVHRNTQ